MESVYFFDDFQKLIKIVSSDLIIEDTQEKEITTNKEDLINSTLTVTIQFDNELKTAAFMAVREQGDNYSMYRIVKVNDPENTLTFTGVDFAPDELDGYIITDIRPKNETIANVAKRLLEDTEWRIGAVDSGLNNVSGTFYYLSVKEALKGLQSFGCEIAFYCTLNGSGIEDKWIDIKKQLGNASEMRYTYGDKALTVVRELDRSNVYTSVIGRGKGEEVGDGYGRRLEFSDIEWKKSNGKPLDKPKGQNWLEMPEMTKLYGIPTKDGGMRKREKVAIFEDEEDANSLLEQTYTELVECSRPLVQFKATVTGADSIGNTVTIHRYDRGYHYQTRVFKLSIDRLTGVIEASIGDNLTSSMARKTSNLTNSIQTLDETKQTFYEATEIGKYQDDIMRGAGKNGGSVYQVNGIESGVSQSRETYEVVYMDGPKIEQSSHFMIQNSEGISFKQCKKGEWKTIIDVHNGKSRTAWTLDGTFNANFIKAGTIEGVDLVSKNNNYKTTITDGSVRFQSVASNKSIGKILASDLLVNNSTSTGMYVNLDNAFPFSIVADNSGRKTEHIGVIPDGFGGVSSNKSVVRLSADQVQVKNSLFVTGKLYVNGREITTGSGGSSGGNTGDWNGQYPPELTTSAEKFAWQAWVTLLSLGYSKAAAAGILGNINGEAGPSMNPDTEQVGGPAYGAVQFDGSAYPLIGSQTNNGREYFQRLHKASGAGGDYREMAPQMKVVDWATKNGQWIGRVPPKTIGEFKGINSPEQAAYAFEENFERPATAHTERQGFARNWYNKFVNLAIPSNDWVNPVRVPYVVTQEWDQIGWGTTVIHGGIDLAPTGGGNPPIYAAKGGTVETVTFDGTGGNYVIINHGDGYWTYYGHFASTNVSAGQKVSNQTQIGVMGATGLASGVHLHFEVWKGAKWQRVNPRSVIKF